jgi:glycine/D-amino acid oxidase-like deaminating enzyme
MLRQVGAMLGIDLPVFSELHVKASFTDHLGVIPREAPLLIWEDPQRLGWSEEERAFLAEDPDSGGLLEEFPAGVHCRPEGGMNSQQILILWPYHAHPVEEEFPLPSDPLFPELALRGMARMIPGLSAYFDQMPRPYVDGGYYTKTQENRPLAGPLPVEGAYVLGALSGFGLMASLGAAELTAAYIARTELPDYAPRFELSRYDDPAYQKMLEDWGPSSQL